jgi:hypothetical protein
LATFLDLLTLAVLLPFLAQRSPYSVIENLAGGHEQHAASEAGIAEMRERNPPPKPTEQTGG